MNKIIINPKVDLIFDDKVVEQCKNCKRYGQKATCPPYIKNSDYYRKLLPRYAYCIFYYKKFIIDDPDNWAKLGSDSSMELMNFILDRRNNLMKQGHYFVIAFGGGSCKLCDICSFPCRFPEKSLIPIEATGMNIVEMMKRFDIEIKYPVKDYFYRVGCVFYD